MDPIVCSGVLLLCTATYALFFILSTAMHSVTPVLTIFERLLGPICDWESTDRIPGLLLCQIAPFLPLAPLMSQRHKLPSSRGATESVNSDSPGGEYSATPRTSRNSRSGLSRFRGCCSQLVDIGACRLMYSSYQLTFSPGKTGSQLARIRTFSLDNVLRSSGSFRGLGCVKSPSP